jgi:hypothetical protein
MPTIGPGMHRDSISAQLLAGTRKGYNIRNVSSAAIA